MITLPVLYNLVVELKDDINKSGLPAMQADIQDHEKRLRELERWVWRMGGMAALAGAGLGTIVQELLNR